ncbi:sodium-dependent transporter [Planctomycetota bacterium]
MAQLLEEQRESWGSRGGFILAAVGSAVGLGNLWGFPYKIYDNGGAAFLIPYIFAMFVVGVPVLILEFSMGHFTQRAAPEAFKRGHKRLEFVGWWGIVLGFVIVTFYPVILAYCFSFLWHSLVGIFNGGSLPWAGEGIEGVQKAKQFFYDEFLGSTSGYSLGKIRPNIVLTLAIAWTAMYFCIFRGVKLVGKIVWLTVPLPWLMLLVLTVNGLMLPGSIKGLAYYLNPDFSELAKPSTWQHAFSQAFFSLSLAFGVMITYASFLHRKSDINNNAAIIGLADFATSFVAGLAIFATLGGMVFVTTQAGNPVTVEQVVDGGPGLAFVAFPYALAQLPGSAWWSFVFFFTLVTLGIDSAFSITESVLAALVDKTGWKRKIVLPVMSLVGLTIGLVFVTQGGLNWLGVVADAIYGTWGIGFVGLIECAVIGWLWRIDNLRRHANDRSDWKLGKWWNYLIRIVIPMLLGTIFIWSLFDDMTKTQRALIDDQGQWVLPNCVGLAIMILAPIVAIILSCVRGPRDKDNQPSERLQVQGTGAGVAAFLLAVVSTSIIVIVFRYALQGRNNNTLLWFSLPPAVIAIIISNYLLDKHNNSVTRPSWFARWAGMIATIDVSGFLALLLIFSTSQQTVQDTVPVTRDQLSQISYVILSIVFLLIVGGFGWCFYKALAAAGKVEETQSPNELGD